MPTVVVDAVRTRLEYVRAQEHQHKTGRLVVVSGQQAHQHQQAKALPRYQLRVQPQQEVLLSTPQEQRMSEMETAYNLLGVNVCQGLTARPHVAQVLLVSAVGSGHKLKLAKRAVVLCLEARLEVYPLL